jgi:hypothetical protein
MADFKSMVDQLIRTQGYVRNSDLTRWFGLPRQRVCILLRRMVEQDELVKHGRGRGVRYTPGRGWAAGPLGVTQGAAPGSMWDLMAELYPDFGYVALALGDKRHFRRRRDAWAVLRSVRRLFVVVDFAGVASATRTFLDALLDPCPPGGGFVHPINMPPHIADLFEARQAAQARTFKPAQPDLAFAQARLLPACPHCGTQAPGAAPCRPGT